MEQELDLAQVRLVQPAHLLVVAAARLAASIEHLVLRGHDLVQAAPHEDVLVVVDGGEVLEQERDDLDDFAATLAQP